MKRFFCLNKEIHPQQVINIIGEMIVKTSSMGDRVLQIEIKPVDHDRIMLPLLEYKGELSKQEML